MPGAVRAKGNLKLQYSTGTDAAPAWVDIPGIRTISGGGANVDRIETTAFDSPGNSKEYMAGLTDPQALSGTCSYIPGNATQAALRAANQAGTTVKIRILLATAAAAAPNPAGAAQEGAAFDCMVAKWSAPTGDPSKELMISFDFMPYVSPTYAVAAA